MRRRLLVAVTALAAGGGASAGIALAAGASDDDKSLRGAALERATDAALAHTGAGTVVETEAGDDGSAYGLEVRLADGRVVEVELDERFRVVGTESDTDGANGEDDDGDDR